MKIKIVFSTILLTLFAMTGQAIRIDVAEPNARSIANIRDADSQPTGIADTYWRNEATGDWLIGFTKQHVIYQNKVWDIVYQTKPFPVAPLQVPPCPTIRQKTFAQASWITVIRQLTV